MRIVFLSYDFGEYSIQHASALADAHEVRLILPECLARSHVYKLDPRVDCQVFGKPRLRQPFRQALCVRRLLRQIEEFEPDVVHFQRGHLWFNWVLPRLHKRYPLVMTIHDPRHHLGDRGSHKTPQWLMDYGYRCAHRVIVHGESIRQTCVDQIGIPHDRIHVVPHIAIGDRPRDDHVRQREGQILFFGRVWEYKGLDYLVQAEPLIRAKTQHGGIVIAGRGDYTAYRRHIERPEMFTIHDEWISDDRRRELFAESSIIVLPYVEATQSGVVPIAYTYGKPIVATRTGALPEAVDDGVTGLIVPPRDPTALASAIVRLLQDKQLRDRLGEAGRRKLETELSPAAVIVQTLEVYEGAIAEFAAAGRPTSVQNVL